MKVYGFLETAQLETFTNAGKPAAASYPYRVIYVSDLTQIQVSDGSTWQVFSAASSSRLSSMYDAVIGSSAQVTAGIATHSSWSSAISAVSSGDTIFVLEGSITENVSLTKQINIIGNGRGSVIDGTFTFASGSSNSHLFNVKVTGDITINSGVNGIIVDDIWLASGKTFVDNSATTDTNYLWGMQE